MNKKIKQITVVILIIILSQIILISDMGNGSSTTMDTILQIIYIISVMIINFVTWKLVTYNSEDNKKKKIIKCIIEIAFLSIAFFY